VETELRLGVDVGRENTDAVVVDSRDRLVAKVEVPTTADPHAAVGAAVAAVLAVSAIDPARVTRAMLGTAHAMDAVLERREVRTVAVVRIGSPLTTAVPPLVTWPAALRRAVSVGETIVRGGADFTGRTVAPLDADAVARFLATAAGRIQSVAITGVFSPVAPDHELAAAEIVRTELGSDVHVSMSHQIGSLGLLERENATVLNAGLGGAAERFATTLDEALAAHGIVAARFFAQNDGSVMALEAALALPVLMIGCGPANSMRGAAYLSGVVDGIVVDVSGATADVGVLVNGYPRELTEPTVVSGVRVNFRMPEVVRLEVGTDAKGVTFAAALEETVERARGASDPPMLVVVGDAGARIPDRMPGVAEVIRPADGDVAKAIGTAMAPVTGQADRICANRPDQRRRAREAAHAAAFEHAVHAGADPAGVTVVHVEEVPLAHMADPAIRIRVKVAGPAGPG
jgi:N-methylhydantoinase A/oxoprolinase/acetone carboxylase beta subunit